MKSIECLSELNRARFNERYFNKQPVVYKGAVKHTRSYQYWTPDYLKSLIGGRMVEVRHSSNGVYRIEDDRQVINVPFDKAVELFTSDKFNNATHYLQEASVFREFPELLNDLEIPQLNSPSDKLERVNFWMGGAGCVTQLHYDGDHNFLVQILGSKELIFYPPADTPYLYPKNHERYGHESQVDMHNVDHDRFPLFKNATPYRAILCPGDALYLPPYWWHQVRSLEMSINVNYWWNRFDVPDVAGIEQMPVENLQALIKSFIDSGFTIDHKDDEGELLLIKAVHKGYGNVVEAFLSLGANPDSKSCKYDPGASALMVAVDKGHAGIVNLLLKYGAKEDYQKAIDLAKKKGLIHIP